MTFAENTEFFKMTCPSVSIERTRFPMDSEKVQFSTSVLIVFPVRIEFFVNEIPTISTFTPDAEALEMFIFAVVPLHTAGETDETDSIRTRDTPV